LRYFIKCLLLGAAFGAVTGVSFSTFEFFLARRRYYFGLEELPVLQLSYALYWALIIAAMSPLVWFLSRRDQMNSVSLAAEYMVITLFGNLIFLLLFKVNAYWTPSPIAPSSIISNAAVLVGGLVMFRLILKYSPRIGNRAGTVMTATVLMVSSVSAIVSVFSGGDDPVARKIDTKASGRTNVLILLVDTLRADHLGCYGYERATSPAIDGFAGESVRFENFIAASSWTLPSVVSLLTGAFPPFHRIYHPTSSLPRDALVAPDAMGSKGYATCLISTNHFVSKTYGFGRGVDFYRASAPTRASSLTSLNYFFAQLDYLFYLATNRRIGLVKPIVFINRRLLPDSQSRTEASWVIQELYEFLDQSSGRPFFAFLHFMEPHVPYNPRPPFNTLFTDPEYQGENLSRPPHSLEIPMPPVSFGKEWPEEKIRFLTAKYDGEIRSFDAYFEELLAGLKQRGVYDNTLIVLTSDHGEEFYEHKAWYHGHSLYQEIVHVPLIIKMPGNEYRGTVIKGMCRHADLLPTLFDLLGLEPWPQFQGISLADVIRERREDWPGTWWAISETYTVYQGKYASSYIEGDYKLIRVKAGKEATVLYNLARDPGELIGLEDADKGRRNQMSEKMERKISELGKDGWSSRSRTLSAEEKKSLKALGYIDN
jgi:arylsulfatase A-like enzyme